MSDQPEDEKTEPEQADSVGDDDATPPDAEQAKLPPALVEKAGDWHRVTFGSWQLSVAPDGLIMLPRHLHPREIAEFVSSLSVAADVGNDLITANEKAGALDDRRLTSRRAIVTEGGTPDGATRMPVKPTVQQQAATIGRPKRRGTGTTGRGVVDARAASHQQAGNRRTQARGK